jgi:NitT/TauT family transport system ATP-binding protein
VSAKIALRGVTHVFPVRGERDGMVALRDVDFEVREGEFAVIVGPSGCGKSTLLDMIAGLTAPTGGEVLVDGAPVRGPGLDRGIVFQQYALLPWRTARGNVEFGLEAQGTLGKAERAEHAQRYLELVGLRGFEQRYPHELSGGMRQRVAIARSLSYEPQILLMDEPFAALDAQTRETLQDELLRIWERTGTTVVFVTHAIDEAVYLGQRIAVMSSRPGRITHELTVPVVEPSRDVDVRAGAEFVAARHELWELLHADRAREVVPVA